MNDTTYQEAISQLKAHVIIETGVPLLALIAVLIVAVGLSGLMKHRH